MQPNRFFFSVLCGALYIFLTYPTYPLVFLPTRVSSTGLGGLGDQEPFPTIWTAVCHAKQRSKHFGEFTGGRDRGQGRPKSYLAADRSMETSVLTFSVIIQHPLHAGTVSGIEIH